MLKHIETLKIQLLCYLLAFSVRHVQTQENGGERKGEWQRKRENKQDKKDSNLSKDITIQQGTVMQ